MYHKLSGHWFVVLTKRLLLFGFILAFGFLGTASAALIDRSDGTAGVSASTSAFWRHARHAAYRAAVHQVMKEFHIPGLVAGVWVPGDRAWKIAEGFGDVRSGRPIALDDHFPIRSITKSFTVTLILQLVRDGKISLDDPIEQYVPGIPNGNEITLAQLAAMESGVKDYTEVEAFLSALVADFGKPWTPQEIIDLAIPGSPVFAPGAEYDYSNTNAILLGMVVEVVT